LNSQSRLESLEPYQQRYRWVILALLWLLYVAFGLVFRSIAPLVTPILKDLNISYSQMGLILGAYPLVYVAVAIVAGTIIDRLGVRKSLFAGIVIIGLSAVLRYFPNGFVTMLLVVALFGVGGPMISIGCPKAISQWFRGKDRGTAVGVYLTGPRIGELLTFTLTNSFVMPLTGYSWRLTFVSYGLLAFVVSLIWWFFYRDIKPAEDETSAGIIEVLRRLIKVRNVKVILIMSPMSFAISHGFFNWLPNILEASGMSPVMAGFAASVPLIAGIVATLVIPRLTPPHLRGRVVALLALVVAITLPAAVTVSGIALIVTLALFGMTASCILPLLMLALMETPEVGSRYMGSAGGMYFCVGEIGGFVGPLVMGALVDMTGGFMAGASFFAVLSIAISAMTLLLRTQKKVEVTS